MTIRDYTPAELEALEALSRPTLVGDWHAFASEPVGQDFRDMCPESAAAIDAENRRNRRLARACRLLLERGLVERGRHPIDRRLVAYRLIPMLRDRGEAAEADSRR